MINNIPTPTNSDNRTTNLNIFPAELFSKAEVVKTPTADMDEGGVAGTIKLETLKPLDTDSTILIATVEGEYNFLGEKLTPKTSLVFGKNWNNKFGMLLGASYYNFYRSAEAYDAVGWRRTDLDVDGDTVVDYENVWLMDIPRYIVQPQDVKRTSVNASFQYKVNPNFDLQLDGIFVNNVQTADRHLAEFFFRPGFVNDIQDISVNGDVVEYIKDGNLLIDAISETSQSTSQMLQTSLAGKWRNEDWELSGNVAYASVPQDREMFRYFANAFAETSYDVRENSRYWDVQTSVDINDPTNYDVTQVRRWLWDNDDKEYSTRADLKRYFNNGIFKTVQVGAKYRDRNKQRQFFFARERGLTGAFDSVSTTFDGFLDHEDEATAPTSFAVFDFDKAYDKYGKNIDLSEAELTDSYYNVTERITSAYALTTLRTMLGKVSFAANLGVRLASTQIISQGQELNAVTDELTDREVTENYLDVLPTINTKFGLMEDLVLRAGFARVLTRPNMTSLAVFRVVDPDNLTISAQNPGLDPFRANQLDLGLEWYFNNESMLSFGYFYKDIESFITTESSEVQYNGDTYILTQPVNGDAASISGFEVNYQQPFTFLPSPFDGFGAMLNYTYTESTYEETLEDGEVFTFGLPNNSKHSYNIIGYYEKYGFSLRLAHNFRSEFLRQKPNPDLGVKYRDDYGQTDLSSSYEITDNIMVTFNVFNLFDSKRYEYIFREDLMDTYFNFGRTYQLGVRYSL